MICIPLGVIWGDFVHLFDYVFYSRLGTDYSFYNTKEWTHDAQERERHDLDFYTGVRRRALEFYTGRMCSGA